MPRANGEFVKLYLYLLRCAGSGRELTLSSIADVFDHTEKDVRRALAYWEKLNLLKLQYDGNGSLSDISILEGTAANGGASAPQTVQAEIPSEAALSPESALSPTAALESAASDASGAAASSFGQDRPQKSSSRARAASSRPSLTRDRMKALKDQAEIKQLIFIAEQYYSRPLTTSEQTNLLYFYDTLHFSADLIEYLVEYCVSKGSTSTHYMEKVAQEWYQSGISTVAEAKSSSNLYNKNYFTIMNSFGIKGRNPAEPEIECMSRWLNEYEFTIEIILEACCRTIRQTHQPNFQYANKILEQWHKAGIRQLSDIKKLDLEYSAQKKNTPAAARPASKASAAPNRFNNFPQREYDWSSLEQQLLSVPYKKEG